MLPEESTGAKGDIDKMQLIYISVFFSFFPPLFVFVYTVCCTLRTGSAYYCTSEKASSDSHSCPGTSACFCSYFGNTLEFLSLKKLNQQLFSNQF